MVVVYLKRTLSLAKCLCPPVALCLYQTSSLALARSPSNLANISLSPLRYHSSVDPARFPCEAITYNSY